MAKDADDLREEFDNNERAAAEQLKADYQFVLGTEQGRRLMWLFLSRAGIFQTSMTGNSWTMWKEGRRALGLWIMGEIKQYANDLYRLMEDENMSKDDFRVLSDQNKTEEFYDV